MHQCLSVEQWLWLPESVVINDFTVEKRLSVEQWLQLPESIVINDFHARKGAEQLLTQLYPSYAIPNDSLFCSWTRGQSQFSVHSILLYRAQKYRAPACSAERGFRLHGKIRRF